QTGAAGFVPQHSAAAQEAERATGIPASFMVSQAALETGWGRKEIRHADGSPSFNLFGIKATGNWKGPVAEITTTEFINGKAQKVVAKFRAYGSYAESFADYARLMTKSPRYQAAVGSVTQGAAAEGRVERGALFAQGLQKAGYATDPAYADKLTRVINTTLRLQRSLT
ncbi:MAG: flagellar assembly peptidoglycan hydrolase FlgJ, partial [Rubrivivax sp.]|nr:flagellar assembly peptidoglycan hydrolase FlgJ [Rubrivivax sp.]